jgi:hypothetical protein
VSYKRLVQAHQLCCAEREGLQLQVNHLQLQVASLQMQNRRLNSKVNEMNLELSEAAERELLQKVMSNCDFVDDDFMPPFARFRRRLGT